MGCTGFSVGTVPRRFRFFLGGMAVRLSTIESLFSGGTYGTRELYRPSFQCCSIRFKKPLTIEFSAQPGFNREVWIS